jgi:hypothetical protein
MRPLRRGLPRAFHQVNPPCSHNMERLSAMWHRLVCQPATHPQAITNRHARPRRWEHDWDFAGLVGIEHLDHTDGCATLIRVDLANIADEDDLVMVPWNAHETPLT